uniref:Uncharacterized protein n=1 Tax=Cacopsylla melanoneura TaxID=428564 RepID=A0A8D8QU12_9HEMI
MSLKMNGNGKLFNGAKLDPQWAIIWIPLCLVSYISTKNFVLIPQKTLFLLVFLVFRNLSFPKTYCDLFQCSTNPLDPTDGGLVNRRSRFVSRQMHNQIFALELPDS